MVMEVQYLIKNGTIVDGTGEPAYSADIRIRDGRIARIGNNLDAEEGERLVDATGCYVTPGFIESHNHWDASMWWSPMLEPLGSYGVTTSINGNCGFSLAPMQSDPAVRADMIEIFNYFEDIPSKAQEQSIPWDSWRTWGEYRAAMEQKTKLAVNTGFFCGHIPLRLTVMGLEAWERAATQAEIAEMCALLDDALASGALGLSSNITDIDKHGRKVPSCLADEAEWTALLGVLGRYPDAMLQIFVDIFKTMTGAEQLLYIGSLVKAAGTRMLWLGMPTLDFQRNARPAFEAVHEGFKAEGLDYWASFHHVAPTIVFNLGSSLTFGQQKAQVWQDLVNLTDENTKLKLLADPDWRAAARASWDGMFAHSTLHDPTSLTFLDSESGVGPVGITLADYMALVGISHPSDALAHWVGRNGLSSAIHKRTWQCDDDATLRMIRDPKGAGNASDGGAHGQILCGPGDNVLLLTDWARDRGLISIEEAVHCMTGKLAECFRMRDRGILKEGMKADVAVFNLAEIERRPQEKVWDVPDGDGGRTYRYSRSPAPMRLTLCNGVAIFDNGAVTGRFPGSFVGR